MKYKDYIRVEWPEWQGFLELYQEEWPYVVGFIAAKNTDVIIPKKWFDDQQEIIIRNKMDLIEEELKTYFKKTYIKKFYLYNEKNYCGEPMITIYPTKPEFDEDYDGVFDDDIEKIGLKYDTHLTMTDAIYGK